ncbi:MAG: MATE family efflux transporter [Proteobacteria bacterium]|nr:MATE family efflux transporter [Pseudomonadota bacterium]
MHDLTKGSITGHIINMAVFIGLGLVFQTVYFLVDLYFVAHLGSWAIAGVSAAGVSSFLVMGASQLVAVGAMALIAQAAGRKDREAANLVSGQALSLSATFSVATLVLGYTFGAMATQTVSADAQTSVAARAYLFAYLPSLALMFPVAALGSALRGAGVVRPTMMLQTLTVILNVVLAPVLIAGWGTGRPLGVMGAGLATTIAVACGFIVLWAIFPRVQKFIALERRTMAPRLSEWGRIVGIGLPAAGEFILMFVIFAVVYWVIRHFGPHAQAGFGVGMRIMQSIFLPVMAVAFAAAPIAGQNFGAGLAERVRYTFRDAALICAALMLVMTLFTQWRPEMLLAPFTSDAQALAYAADYLRIVSWNFVASGVVFTCSSMFQGLGDTRPSLLASASRLLTFMAPAIALAVSGGLDVFGMHVPFTLHTIWILSVASVYLQMLLAVALLRRQLKVKLKDLAPRAAATPAPVAAE